MHAGDRPQLRRTTPTPSPAPLLAWAGGVTALLFAGAIWPVAPLRDAATGAAAGAGLYLTPAFVVLAPLNNTLDALSLLSVREHTTVWLALAVAYGAWRFMRRRAWRISNPGTPGPGAPHEVRLLVIALLWLVAVYATGALVSRPMAAIELPASDSDLVTIDFHSHTNASHDGRTWFTPERNREWHHAAGYDAAYISDHFTFAGAEAGVRANPPRASDGTVLFSAIECLEGGQHVNVLGVGAPDYALFDGRYLAAAAMEAAVAAGRTRPVIVQTIPGSLGRIPRAGMAKVVPVTAIEVADAAPRGLSDGDRNRAWILALADTLDLAIVSGSDNHGWGRTAAAWSVMRVPGWRDLAPPALEQRIEDGIRTDRRRAVHVIERTRPVWPTAPGARGIGGWVSIATGAPRFLAEFIWQLTATRSWPERLSWMAWLWAAVLLVMWRDATRASARHGAAVRETP
jgi:predicted metal-dependent phosphoesterase TrpH